MSELILNINRHACIGCGACVESCPFAALSMPAEVAVVDPDKCTLCGACVKSCPVDAIKMPETPKAAPSTDPAAYRDVWVFAEQIDGHIQSITHELLGEGRKLADTLGVKLGALLLGHDMNSRISELTERGADMVYLADHPELAVFQDERYAATIIAMVRAHRPQILLCGATNVGRSLVSRVAVTLNTGLTADCTALAIDPETRHLLQTRPAFGGNIMATIETPAHRPQMATVRHKVMKEAPVTPGRTGETVVFELAEELLKARSRRIGYTAAKGSTVNLAEANIIVSGGRGMQKPENFALLEELAGVIGAGVGASRAVVDANWIPYAHQVGQTGKTVCPTIYIACGISGQIQHMAGMSSSDVIIAINKDRDAPIFASATYGIVGDALQIVPLLTKAFRKMLGSQEGGSA